VFDIGDFDSTVNPLDGPSLVFESLQYLHLEAEGEFQTENIYTKGSSSTLRDGMMKEQIFIEALCNLLER
jgi:hypothetical protein